MTKNSRAMLVALSVSLAAFMEILDSTIVNVALHDIAGSLGTGMDESTWILTSYLVANGMALPLSSWLARRWGRKTFFIACIIGFSFSSFLCGLAVSMPMLVICRLLQGLSGGGLQPSQQAIIKDSFPPEKLGAAFAISGIATVFAPIIGPVLGGFIVDSFSWRWIFFINVPVGLLAIFLIEKLVDEGLNEKEAGVPFDFTGMALLAISIGSLQVALDNGQRYNWFSNEYITGLMVTALVTGVFSVYWTWRQKNPILNLHLFKIRSFRSAAVTIFFVGAFVNVTVMLLPMLVQEYYNYTALQAGLILLPGGLVSLMLLPLIARLSKVLSNKTLILIGMVACTISMYYAMHLSVQMGRDDFVLLRVLQSMGLPFIFVANAAMAFSEIDRKDSNHASAIIVLMKNIGGSFGISLITSYLVNRQQINQANLIGNLTDSHWGYQMALQKCTEMMQNVFLTQQEAAHAAMAQIYQQLQLQAAVLSYVDVFELLMVIFMLLIVWSLFLPGTKHQVSKKEVQ